MNFSKVGITANELWHEIPNHFKNVELGAFVVMPNHIHGIIIITNSPDNKIQTNVDQGHALDLLYSPIGQERTIGQKRFQNIEKNSIPSIVGSYKSAVTKHANRQGLQFQWQRRFYDHIIRNPESFENISNYIICNPLNWSMDQYF